MNLRNVFSAILMVLISTGTNISQTRSLAQDPALNNLKHAPGTETVPNGTLGNIRKIGEGRLMMLLIPGLGFGDGIWTDFMDRHKADYTMFAITLPGFGGTRPLAMPEEMNFAEMAWTRSTIQAIEQLLVKEKIERVTIVAHWALASQIALRLALDHPNKVASVVLIGGPLKSYFEQTPAMLTWTPQQRADFAEMMGERWFKTVTRQTWDDNNFMSYDYAVNPLRGLFLWREAQRPALAVWIRYLLEFYSRDLSIELKDLKVPTLVVQPGFDDPGFYVEQSRNYMRNLCIDSWKGADKLSNKLEFITIPTSRLFIMYDQPEELDRAVKDFLQRIEK